MLHRLVGGLVLLSASWAICAGDDTKAKPKGTSDDRETAIVEQERLARQFDEFKLALLNMAQRLERSPRAEDRERAAVLKQAIAETSKLGTSNKFEGLIRALKANKSISLNEVKQAMDDSRMVADDIRSILGILLSDNRDAQLKAERDRLEKMLKNLDKVITDQKILRARTEAGKSDKNSLGKSQEKVTKSTELLAKNMSKDGKSSEPKDGQPKDSKEGKGEPKEGKDKKGESPDSKGKDSKEDKAGSKKKDLKDDASNEGKNKDGSPKEGQPKDGQPKNGQPKEGQPKSGQPKEGQPKEGEPKEGQPKSNENQSPQEPDALPGKKQIEDAVQNQNRAKKKIEEEKKDDASKEQDEAIKKLEEVRKKWEEILRQLREEELERRLANLQQRCERMLNMQIEVYEATIRVEKAVLAQENHKPSRDDEQRALQLSDREQQIVREASQALGLLEEEGSAVAFTETLLQVRDDMQNVQRRLGKADVGNVTQTIEQDIVAALKEMVEALKKAQQDMQDRKQQQQQQQQQNQQGNQSLIDMIAELKIIRSMQLRVNNRTLVYGRQYKGEQANEADIQKELYNLAERQKKIFDVTNNIARGKNK